MQIKRATIEHLLYATALILALTVRLVNLGAAPLAEVEAGWALQAWQVSGAAPDEGPGIAARLGPQPAYVLLTGAAFALFGATNFLARFWPALAGSLLVLLPLLLRPALSDHSVERTGSPKWGRAAGILLAFGLALDPGLVASARLAGGPMLALTSTLFALGLWQNRRVVLAGLAAGLALLSGPAALTGLLGLLLAWAAARLVRRGPVFEPDPLPPADFERGATRGNAAQAGLWAAGATVLAVGTLFFRYPRGLGGWAETFPAYLSGWGLPVGASVLQVLLALAFYGAFPLIFGLIWLGRDAFSADRSPLTMPVALWAGAALLLTLMYPARQVADLVWVLVPLWILAAQELALHLPEGELNPIALAQAGLVFILLALFWYTIASFTVIAPGPQSGILRWAVLSGILALGGLTTILISLGWSWEAGRLGLMWGLAAALTVYSLAALLGASQVRPTLPQELWTPPPASGQAGLLTQTLGDLSEWAIGDRRRVDGVVVIDPGLVNETQDGCRPVSWLPPRGTECPRLPVSLRWALRQFPNIRFSSQLPVGEMPSVVITQQSQNTPELAAAYRGQDFAWWIYPGWSEALPPDFIRWLAFRQAPLLQEQVILWARADLFPGGESLLQSGQ